MAIKFKADVRQALDDWKAGKPVRAIELGHVHRMKENPGKSPRIDLENRLQNDQERAYAYCFHIIDYFANVSYEPALNHEDFLKICDVLEAKFRAENHQGLTAEELDGAESLAWKVLLVGWRKAIDGFGDADYIEVTRETVKAT